jgi:hypothetical protein
MWDPQFTIEEVTDPAVVERHREQAEHFARNSRWLEEHWPDLLPQACGRFVAVAGQEGFVAESAAEGWSWAERVHPEDTGPLVQYVFPNRGPRSYAHRWILADLR